MSFPNWRVGDSININQQALDINVIKISNKQAQDSSPVSLVTYLVIRSNIYLI